MAVYSRGRTETTSPERTKIWVEPKQKTQEKVSVVYYLSRNGQLEHPHLIEVPLSSPQGLYLRDVIKRLNFLRGQGMASMYLWSSKRSYKNGFVWQDLSENDYIYPCQGNEYILKGSQLLDKSTSFRSYETAKSTATKSSWETNSSSDDSISSAIIIRKNRSWGTLNDANEYKVYKGTIGMNASTQTKDDERLRMLDCEEVGDNKGTGIVELDREEVSPWPSSFCLGTTESLKNCISKADRLAHITDQSANRRKAPLVLMQLVACGSRRMKDSP